MSKFVDCIMLSGRLISQITAKNDIISIVYTKETLRNRGTSVTVRKWRMSLSIMIMGPFLTLCFAFIPSETDIKQIRLEPGGLSFKRLLGMCRWMGSHFHDRSDYNGVAFSIELLDKKIRKLLFINFNNKLALTALHSTA